MKSWKYNILFYSENIHPFLQKGNDWGLKLFLTHLKNIVGGLCRTKPQWIISSSFIFLFQSDLYFFNSVIDVFQHFENSFNLFSKMFFSYTDLSPKLMMALFFLFFSLPSGPFIERAIIASQTSEALWFRSEDLLQKPAEQQEEEEKAVLTI